MAGRRTEEAWRIARIFNDFLKGEEKIQNTISRARGRGDVELPSLQHFRSN